jgi:hypothetical protein
MLLPAWTTVTGAARWLQVVLLHHLSHRPHGGWPRTVFEIVSSALLITSYERYRKPHLEEHHRSVATPADADARYIASLGFRPGRAKRASWSNLYRTLFSPGFHLRTFAARLRENFVAPSAARIALAIAIHVAFLALVALTGAWLAYALGFLLPVTVFYQASVLLQLVCEHRWFHARGSLDARTHQARLTFARFVGEAPPQQGSGRAWARFWLRMFFVHLPARMVVLVGDMPQHDAHHRRPATLDWPNAAYARQRDVEAGMWPYDELWGLRAAIDEVFTSLSQASSKM